MRTAVKVGLLVWSIMMGLWFWGTYNRIVDTQCGGANVDREICARNMDGTALGFSVILILFVAAAGFVILGVLWMVGKPRVTPTVAPPSAPFFHEGYWWTRDDKGQLWWKDEVAGNWKLFRRAN